LALALSMAEIISLTAEQIKLSRRNMKVIPIATSSNANPICQISLEVTFSNQNLRVSQEASAAAIRSSACQIRTIVARYTARNSRRYQYPSRSKADRNR